jgi:hypothetical protein
MNKYNDIMVDLEVRAICHRNHIALKNRQLFRDRFHGTIVRMVSDNKEGILLANYGWPGVQVEEEYFPLPTEDIPNDHIWDIKEAAQLCDTIYWAAKI